MRPDYKGWSIQYAPRAPIAGQWSANRFGVWMNNNSEESIKRMIDTRVNEERERNRQ